MITDSICSHIGDLKESKWDQNHEDPRPSTHNRVFMASLHIHSLDDG
ncbi:hypothetical protein SAMN05443550_11835 [Pedobacter hartonius]|uniref:Uncharacterized protein n=1 Tax=Pedobacter hartonius TaxID=425514 RepID=A0A1H4HGR3_9SPHI|nr:hypothetical protein SAMN05443550_11835 [Pedobacter hartonius]